MAKSKAPRKAKTVPEVNTKRTQAEVALESAHAELEKRVAERTIELRQAVDSLSLEAEQRRRVEMGLRESEERFRDLYQEAPVAYLSVGVDGRIRAANRRAGELLGCSAEELVGRPVLDLYADTPDGKAKASEVIRRFRAGQETRDEELRMQRADGTQVWISLSVRPIRDAMGEVVATRSTAVDITERRRADEEARKFKTISDNANYGVAMADLAGNITYVNDYFAGVHGYKPAQLIGKNLSIFHNEKQLEEVIKINQGLQERGSYSALEVWHTHKDGSVFPMLMNGMILTDKDGQPLFMAATAIDITERKRAEEALRRAREELEGKVERQMLRTNPYGLTFRELTILHLVAAGRADKEIAGELGISPLTVHKHVSNILGKMNAASRTEAGTRALREGLLD